MTDLAGCKRVIAWGGNNGDKLSHRHIWRAYKDAARKLGIPALWLNDTATDAARVQAGDLVFAIDIWTDALPVVKGARYIFHNLPGSHPFFEQIPEKDWIRLQVYSSSAHGEKLAPCRYWIAENRTLIQPWGTDLFAEEFWDPVFNAHSRDAVFVGAVWNTDGQGNAGTIVEVRDALKANGLRFLHKTQISDDEMLILTRAARLAPAFAGPWQVENDYLPCRCFKNSSYGQLLLTNVPRFYDLYADCSLQSETIPDLVAEALSLKRGEWIEMVMCQQRVTARFTYRESLETIAKVFES